LEVTPWIRNPEGAESCEERLWLPRSGLGITAPENGKCHTYGMSVRTTIDIPDDLHAELRRRAAAERTSIRSLVTSAIETTLRPRQSRQVTGPLVGKTGKKAKPAAGSPNRENPYDVLFA